MVGIDTEFWFESRFWTNIPPGLISSFATLCPAPSPTETFFDSENMLSIFEFVGFIYSWFCFQAAQDNEKQEEQKMQQKLLQVLPLNLGKPKSEERDLASQKVSSLRNGMEPSCDPLRWKNMVGEGLNFRQSPITSNYRLFLCVREKQIAK